jgi:hypothetical protein
MCSWIIRLAYIAKGMPRSAEGRERQQGLDSVWVIGVVWQEWERRKRQNLGAKLKKSVGLLTRQGRDDERERL